jgi:hypothetical protein
MPLDLFNSSPVRKQIGLPARFCALTAGFGDATVRREGASRRGRGGTLSAIEYCAPCLYGGLCHIFNMASGMVKVTYTIDQVTAVAVKELSDEWGVPQSEAVRRAIRQARQQQLMHAKARSPVEVLEQLERGSSLSATESKARLQSARRLRKSWNLRKTD